MVTKRDDRSGFVLITIVISTVLLFAGCGVVVDLGRLWVVRNELRVFAESAALAAAIHLNGESDGIDLARNEVELIRAASEHHLGTQALTKNAVIIEFGRSLDSNPPSAWTMTPPHPPRNYRYVRVTPRMAVPVEFMPMFTGASTVDVRASAIAGQTGNNFPHAIVSFTLLTNDSRPGSRF